MQIDIKPEIIEDLREILTVLQTVAEFHKDFVDEEVLIEPWTPSDSESMIMIDIPDFNVGLARKAERIRKTLRL